MAPNTNAEKLKDMQQIHRERLEDIAQFTNFRWQDCTNYIERKYPNLKKSFPSLLNQYYPLVEDAEAQLEKYLSLIREHKSEGELNLRKNRIIIYLAEKAKEYYLMNYTAEPGVLPSE